MSGKEHTEYNRDGDVFKAKTKQKQNKEQKDQSSTSWLNIIRMFDKKS